LVCATDEHFCWSILVVICFVYVAGVYSFCFENGMNRYSSKVVYFYLLSYVYADWMQYTEEIKEFQGEINNFTASCIINRLTTLFQQ